MAVTIHYVFPVKASRNLITPSNFDAKRSNQNGYILIELP